MDLFDLAAKITLETSSYEKGLADAQSKTTSFGGKLKTALGTAGKIGGAAIGAVAGATAALSTALIKGTSNLAAYGDNIDKMSQKMGLSAEAYQEWDAVMKHSGTSIEAMQAGMKTLANAVENGNEAFQRLGMSQEEIAGMSQEELFDATITALQNVENETERTYLAGQLLGRGATELGALLNTSAEDTQAMKDRVHELGGVMSDEAVKSAAAFQDSLQDMQTAFAGLGRGMISDMMPAITTVMDGLTEIFSGNGDAGIEMISTGIDQLVTNITDKLPAFIDLAFGIISALVDTLIDNLPKLLEMGGEFIGKLIAGIISKLPDLIAKVPDIIKAIISGLVAAWPAIKTAGMDLIKVLMDGISALWEKLKAKGKEIIDVIRDGIKQKINDAKKWGQDLIDNFVNGIKEKIQKVKDAVSNVANTVKNFLGFSEPELGPLSNFHTYAPDMMKLFAQGIKDNERLITDQISRSFDFGERITAFGGKTGNWSGIREAEISDPVQPIQLILDGRVISETVLRYDRSRKRMAGV